MSELVRCDLCGRDGHGMDRGRGEIAERLVVWTDAVRATTQLPEFDTVNRCLDFQACRGRVESAGGTWPVRDAVTRPTVRRRDEREEVPA